MRRHIALICGAAGLVAAGVPMVAFALFLAGGVLPGAIDGRPAGSRPAALSVDLALLVSFALVHSALARPRAKAIVTRLVPEPLERSVYSILAGAQVALLVALWRPLPEAVWNAGAPLSGVLWALQAGGWLITLAALREVGFGDLFGWAQARAWARGESYVPRGIATGGPYRFVRHPIYSGTILAMLAAPRMSEGHLLLAAVLSAYLLIGLRFEEVELAHRQGAGWGAYRDRVPALLPRLAPRPRMPPGPDPGA